MALAMRMANDAISFNQDLQPYEFCRFITNLYLPYQNPDLDYLCRFQKLLPEITKVASSPHTPMEQRESHFLGKVSSKVLAVTSRSFAATFSSKSFTRR